MLRVWRCRKWPHKTQLTSFNTAIQKRSRKLHTEIMSRLTDPTRSHLNHESLRIISFKRFSVSHPALIFLFLWYKFPYFIYLFFLHHYISALALSDSLVHFPESNSETNHILFAFEIPMKWLMQQRATAMFWPAHCDVRKQRTHQWAESAIWLTANILFSGIVSESCFCLGSVPVLLLFMGRYTFHLHLVNLCI